MTTATAGPIELDSQGQKPAYWKSTGPSGVKFPVACLASFKRAQAPKTGGFFHTSLS